MDTLLSATYGHTAECNLRPSGRYIVQSQPGKSQGTAAGRRLRKEGVKSGGAWQLVSQGKGQLGPT
eukprot:296772-Chlamydomonas_euryale.AAC.1